MKYIAPLLGNKMPIYINDEYYHKNERKKHYPVEMWERDAVTRQIRYPATKLDFIDYMRTADEEESLKIQLLL